MPYQVGLLTFGICRGGAAARMTAAAVSHDRSAACPFTFRLPTVLLGTHRVAPPMISTNGELPATACDWQSFTWRRQTTCTLQKVTNVFGARTAPVQPLHPRPCCDRYLCWGSSRRGDFMVSPRGCAGATFYVVVMDDPGHTTEGINEWVVGVPKKTGLMASCKTNNYLLNALTAMESQVCYGYFCPLLFRWIRVFWSPLHVRNVFVEKESFSSIEEQVRLLLRYPRRPPPDRLLSDAASKPGRKNEVAPNRAGEMGVYGN